MRIRRLEVDWVCGKSVVDFRSESGSPLPIIGIVGNNGSGKSLLQSMALRLYSSSLGTNRIFLDWDEVSGYCEYEYNGSICTGMVKSGKIIQSIVHPNTVMGDRKVSDGCLFFDTSGILDGNLIVPVCSDLYRGEIRNSVIWVDSFDVGLDDNNAQEFLKVMVKKSLERNNQLIVSTVRRHLLSGIGEDAIRQLGNGTNLVTGALKNLK
jgi:ABC-type dipeptide/oligopeptide/nickel transport system ATPase component